MAISTYKIFLMQKDTSDYKKLIDIKSFPDLGGEPEALDTTTLSDKQQTYIPGIEKTEPLKFNANYTLSDYKKLKALEDKELDLSVWLGGEEAADTVTPTGSDGKYNFKGYISVYLNGGGVNEVVGMTISVAPTTAITISE
ncbi:MAG: phage tail protein [Acutalibacteraceae bacterium]